MQAFDAAHMVEQKDMAEIAHVLGIRLRIQIAWDQSWKVYGQHGPIRHLYHTWRRGGDPTGNNKGHFEPMLVRSPSESDGGAGSAPSSDAHPRVAADTPSRLTLEAMMDPHSEQGQEWARLLLHPPHFEPARRRLAKSRAHLASCLTTLFEGPSPCCGVGCAWRKLFMRFLASWIMSFPECGKVLRLLLGVQLALAA